MRALATLLCCHLIQQAAAQTVFTIRESGPQAERINIVLLCDGYTAAEQPKARADVAAIYAAMVGGFHPFEDRVDGYAVLRTSKESGADEPTKGIYKDTWYGAAFDNDQVGGTARLLVVSYWGNYSALVDAALAAQTNVLPVIVVNSSRYGGSGGMVLVTSMEASAPEIARHEMGHTFAGLADEYCTAYPGWRYHETANTSTNRLNPPWLQLFGPGWIAGGQYDCVGVGRRYTNCKMKTLGQPFCAVCSNAIAQAVIVRTTPAVPQPGRRRLALRIGD